MEDDFSSDSQRILTASASMISAQDALTRVTQRFNFSKVDEAQEGLRSLAAGGQVLATYKALALPRRSIPSAFWSATTYRQFDWERGTFKASLPPELAGLFPGSQGDTITLYGVEFESTAHAVRPITVALPTTAPEAASDNGDLAKGGAPGKRANQEMWDKIVAALLRLAMDGKFDSGRLGHITSKAGLAAAIRRDRIWGKGSAPSVNTIKPYTQRIFALLQIDLP